MAAIGGVTPTLLKAITRPGDTMTEVSFSRRPGVDGLVVEKLGNRAGPFVLHAILIGDASAVAAFKSGLAALAGAAAVTVTLDSGESWANCYVGRNGAPAVEITRNEAVIYQGTSQFICEAVVHGERSAT